MSVEEIALAIACNAEPLIGIVHLPAQPARRGVLAVVAGGPQYRAGCCRQLVYMARALSAQGIPVMRFDYRGMGDSAGDFLGFQHVEDDLAAALDAFTRTVPGLSEVVLWGGCDAASAILINAHRYPIVTGLILGNPYAHSEETRAAVERHYYLARLRDKAFWAKLLKLKFNPLPAMRSLWKAFVPKVNGKENSAHASARSTAFTERMLSGLKRYRGKILLIMSGQSLTSQEFDELVVRIPAWRKAVDEADIERVDIPHADQAFSTIEARESMITAAQQWLAQWPK